MRVLINAEIGQEHMVKVRTGFPAVEIRQTADPQLAREQAKEAEVIVTWWNGFVPELLFNPRLRWVHTLSAGVEGFLLPPIEDGRVLLTNSRGIHGIPISEHVLALMLAFSRGLNHYVAQQARSQWRRVRLTELRGKTLGVVGFGNIGREIARLGEAFGMRVIAVRRNPAPDAAFRVVASEGQDMVLRESDYLVLALPLTNDTRHFIGAAQLRLMKTTAILINIARGEVVDEKALVEALEQGLIAGAGLDVFETEPLPPDSPLWQMDNCIITPHCAALSPQYMTRAIDLFCHNLDAYLKGEPLPTLVDPRRGY